MRHLAAVAALLCLTACGYRLAGDVMPLPQGVETLHVTLFENRTSAPYLHNDLTDGLLRRLLRVPELDVQNRVESADAVLSGAVLNYSIEVAAYDSADAPQQYRAVVEVEAQLKRPTTGRVLWRGHVLQSAEFLADPDLGRQADLERQAQRLIAERLADDIYAMMTADF